MAVAVLQLCLNVAEVDDVFGSVGEVAQVSFAFDATKMIRAILQITSADDFQN